MEKAIATSQQSGPGLTRPVYSAVPNRRVPPFVIFEKKVPSKDVYYQPPRLATFKIFRRDTHDYTGVNLEICVETRSFSCILSLLYTYSTSI